MDLTVNIDTEDIQRQALKILYDGLNAEITARSANWTSKDTAYFASIGRTAPGYTVELILDENFYPGTVPSLIQAPLENYPNCSAFAWQAQPKGSQDDIGEIYSVTLAIEIMVKSIDSELEANSRIQKSMEAAHAVIMADRSLNHLVAAIGAPRKSLGDVFVRRAEKSRGDRWFWQGGTLEYNLDKYIRMV